MDGEGEVRGGSPERGLVMFCPIRALEFPTSAVLPIPTADIYQYEATRTLAGDGKCYNAVGGR